MAEYIVETLYTTDENGARVPDDMPEDVMPGTWHGPFATLADAEHWMNEVYPDGNTDLHDQWAIERTAEHADRWLNAPDSLYAGPPDAPIGVFWEGAQRPTAEQRASA